MGSMGLERLQALKKYVRIGRGIIYVGVPENISDFYLSFAEAIGFKNLHHGGIVKFIAKNIYGRQPLPGILTI